VWRVKRIDWLILLDLLPAIICGAFTLLLGAAAVKMWWLS